MRAIDKKLFVCIQAGDSTGWEKCLQEGADANAAGKRGETPLMVAARMPEEVLSAQPGLIQELLDAGADPAAVDAVEGVTSEWIVIHRIQEQERKGVSFYARTQNTHTEDQRTAMKALEDTLEKLREHRVYARLVLSEPELGLCDASGRTALHIAAEEGNVAYIRNALASYAVINRISAGGTPAFHAARAGQAESLKLLVNADESWYWATDSKRDNVGALAVRSGSVETLAVVLEALEKKSGGERDSFFQGAHRYLQPSLLLDAVNHGELEMVEMIAAAEKTAPGARRINEALEHTVGQGHPEAFRALLPFVGPYALDLGCQQGFRLVARAVNAGQPEMMAEILQQARGYTGTMRVTALQKADSVIKLHKRQGKVNLTGFYKIQEMLAQAPVEPEAAPVAARDRAAEAEIGI